MDPAEQLARDGAVLLRGFAGEPADVERLFGHRIQELSGPIDYEVGSWELEPGDIVVSHGNATRFRRGTRDELRPSLGSDALHVAAVPGTFGLSSYLEDLFDMTGLLALRAFGGDVEAAGRLVGKPIAEVTEGPLDYVWGSHRWPGRAFSARPEDIGEMYDTSQVRVWNYGPGDVQVANGNVVRLRREPEGDDYLLGEDLGEDVLHVSYVVASPLA